MHEPQAREPRPGPTAFTAPSSRPDGSDAVDGRAPRPTWPHCLRLLTSRTGETLQVEARYVLDDLELRVRVALNRGLGCSSWGCVEQRRHGEWERLLWVEVDELAAGDLDLDALTDDWRAIMADDAHDLAARAATSISLTAITA